MAFVHRLRELLRPFVHGVRHAADRAGRLLRPPVGWDGRHHPALSRFEPWRGEADGHHLHDFLGIRTSSEFRPQFRPDPPGPVAPGYPPPHAGYFELAFVLDSVIDGARRDRFRMLELGSGYGPWLVLAHRAMERLDGPQVDLVGVEMVARHVDWMRRHLHVNGIDPTEHTLLHAAVGDHDGEVAYRPIADLRFDFGQRVVARGADAAGATSEERSGSLELVRVPSIDVRRLLRERGPFDLIHADIQGEEMRVLPVAIEELARVRRLLVATHSRRIHRRLGALFAEAGWQTVWSFRPRRRERTPFGDVRFLDGLLALENPRPPERRTQSGARTRTPKPLPG